MCILEGLTEEEIAKLRESKSGLYLDDLEGGVNLRAISQIDYCKDFAEKALSARNTALKKIEADVLTSLSNKYKADKKPYIGVVGKTSYTSNLNVSKKYQYLHLKPHSHSDGVLKLNRIRLIASESEQTTFRIIDGNGNEIYSVEVQTQKNTFVTIPAPEGVLPLSENGAVLSYYLVWDRVSAMPKNVKTDCNCGGGTGGYKVYFEAEGGEADSLNNLTEGTDAFTHGLALDVEIRCLPQRLICREYDRENAIAVTMAWATLYKTGEMLIEAVLSSGEVNRYTMMGRDYLWGKRNHFKKEYEMRVEYLGSTIDAGSSDCFICRESRIFMGGIIS